MCSEPLTVGGGVSMAKTSLRGRVRSNVYTPSELHAPDQRSSMPARLGFSGTDCFARGVDIGTYPRVKECFLSTTLPLKRSDPLQCASPGTSPSICAAPLCMARPTWGTAEPPWSTTFCAVISPGQASRYALFQISPTSTTKSSTAPTGKTARGQKLPKSAKPCGFPQWQLSM